MLTPREDFDWTGDGAVVLAEQPATAVYANQFGAIVIRQERSWDESDDTLVVIRPENARLVALSILAAAGFSQSDLPPEQELRRARNSGAERQKRYRDRHKRNAGTVTGDDESDGQRQLLEAG